MQKLTSLPSNFSYGLLICAEITLKG